MLIETKIIKVISKVLIEAKIITVIPNSMPQQREATTFTIKNGPNYICV